MRPLLLVGFAESLSAPEVVFSLISAGFRVRLFTRRGRPCRLARSLALDLVEVTAPETDVLSAHKDLIAACQGVDGVFALDDVSLRLFADVSEQIDGVVQIHATGERAEVGLNKERQLKAAREAGLDVPEGSILTDPRDLSPDIALPAIAKPVHAVEQSANRIIKGDVHYLMTQGDVARFRSMDKIPGPLIVQPLIHGVGEGVFGHATEDGILHWSGHRRLRMMNPHGSGSSACETLTPDIELRHRIEQMMLGLGWRGPFMIELLRDETGTPWFMELNGRVWGSMALARRNGFDYPAWAAEAAFDPGFKPQRGAERRRTVRHLGRDILHLLFLVRGPKTEFHRETWPGLWRSLVGVLQPGKAEGFYNYDPAYPRFFLGDAWDTVSAMLKKRR